MATNANPARRPVLVAGDSDTDIAMLKDSTGLKLVLNRNKLQIMCNAYANHGASWLVNPMFISPNACRQSAYACAAGLDHDGVLLDEVGAAIADQADAVCMLP